MKLTTLQRAFSRVLRARGGEFSTPGGGPAPVGRLRPRLRASCLLAVFGLLGFFLLARLAAWYRTLLTPVWGVVVQPDWVVVRGTRPVALVTLAIPDSRHQVFREVSLREKAEYARAHGYWFITCNVSLDASRSPVWSKLRLVAAVLEQARSSCRRVLLGPRSAHQRAAAGGAHGVLA